MGKRKEQQEVEIAALAIESNVDGSANLLVSFSKLCRIQAHVPRFFIYHHAEYKVFLNRWKYISVVQKYCMRDTFINKFQVSVNTSFLAKITLSVKAVWIPNIYQKYKSYTRHITKECNKIIIPFNLACYNLSGYNFEQQRYFLYLKVIPSLNTTKLLILQTDTLSSSYTLLKYLCVAHSKTLLLSWQNVSHICEKVSASLPYFTSRSDFEAFLALLSLNDQLTPVEAVFLGLRIELSPQVGFPFFVNC